MAEQDLRPYDDPYLGQIRRIRDLLDAGLPVLVVHNEFITRKELVLTPRSTMTTFGKTHGLGDNVWWHLSWTGMGSMWVPADGSIHSGYVAEKLDIRKWPGDAKSITAFLKSLAARDVIRAEED